MSTYSRHAPAVSVALLGEPREKRGTDWRWGNHGSLSLNPETGEWYDHEAGEGGGILDLIKRETGRVTVKASISWLEENGYKERDEPEQAKPKQKARVVKTYDYADQNGELRYQVCRMEPKSFRQRQPNGSGWEWSVKGVEQLPYRLGDMLARPSATVLIAEGEKDADRLTELGFVATCNSGGAGKWPSELNQWFAGRRVVILPDNDQAGRDHAEQVAKALYDNATSVRVVFLPGLPDKGDPFDWIESGGTQDALTVLCRHAEEWQPSDDEAGLPSAPVEKLAKRITKRLAEHLEIGANDDEARDKVAPDVCVIDAMLNGVFWTGSKFYLLNESEALNEFSERDSWTFLQWRFGLPVDRAAVEKAAKRLEFGCKKQEKEEDARRKHVGAAMDIAGDEIKDHLKYYNQRKAVEWRCDMFAEQSRMELIEDKARVVLTHKPITGPSEFEPEIVEDFKDHFPRFHEFLTFLVMSRFAADRKKCYLWILADSDWGKGFLMGVLKRLNMAVETSMKEVEKMFEGGAVGRSPEEFKRAFALVIDEFKAVKSELKQLQSEINLAPKHQLTASVEVFAKVFLSAESVASLVTEDGIEDQFANRMSIFEERGSLEERPMFKQVGTAVYHHSVTAYAAKEIEGMVQRMRTKGRLGAQTNAGDWLSDFHGKYGIGTRFGRFSDTLPQVAAEARAWVLGKYREARDDHFVRWQHSDKVINDDDSSVYLKSPRVVLTAYLEDHFDRSELGTYRRRAADILASMSADGKGQTAHRIAKNGGRVTNCVLLKPA